MPASGEPWQTRFDVRVEDHATPLPELRRLVRFARAYEMAGQADDLLAKGAREEATGLYVRAAELAPEADELVFWAGIGVSANDFDRGVALVREAVAVKPAWLTLLERLPAELEPMAGALLSALGPP